MSVLCWPRHVSVLLLLLLLCVFPCCAVLLLQDMWAPGGAMGEVGV